MLGPVGIAANPASGKDVRRLVARASVFDNQEKCAIVRRLISGAVGVGMTRFRYVPDTHRIVQAAVDEFQGSIDASPVDAPQTATALDTRRGAAALHGAGCMCVVTLGGDGTNRAFVQGWRDVILVPISTGTNNVFPQLIEATVAGAAAGLVALGAVPLAEAARRAKRVVVEIENEPDDLALIDAVVTNERFVGARALLEETALRVALLTRADPAAVGITAVGGLLEPLADADSGGLLLHLGSPRMTVRAPIAPGLYRDVPVGSYKRLPFSERVEVVGPCVLAFDGERERLLGDGQRATFRVERDGPWVVDVPAVMHWSARRGYFRFNRGGAAASRAEG